MHPVFAIENPEFVVVGGALAVWAVVLSILGVTRNNFPVKLGGERTVMAISGLLAVGAIAMGIGFATNQPKAGAETSTTSSSSAGAAPATGGAAQTLSLSADPSGALKFDKTSLAARAGTVKIVLTNPAPLAHNISLQGPGGVNLHGPTVPNGKTSQVTANLKPGSYTFYCSVPGHRQAGMQGTLTVK